MVSTASIGSVTSTHVQPSQHGDSSFEDAAFLAPGLPEAANSLISPMVMEVSDETVEGQKQQLIAGKNNNSSQAAHMQYQCPSMPQPPCDIGHPETVKKRVACRMTMRPNPFKFVTLNFRVMRRDAEMHVGQILSVGGVKRGQLYTPIIVDRWTRKLQIKLKSSIKVSVVFASISARLGLQSTVGLKYCLDGFYGVEAFGDAFGNFGPGICPWMEVMGSGTPLSLQLEDGDNIYINIPTEKMLELARTRASNVSEQAHKKSQQKKLSSRVSLFSLPSHRDSGEAPQVELKQ